MIGPLHLAKIEVAPLRLTLREPFAVAYATMDDVPTILVRVSTENGLVGWGEATPDPNVTGETYASTLAMLVADLAPALIGHDARDREGAIRKLDAVVEAAPAAKAALDIALNDLVARAADLVNIKLMKTGGLVNALRVNAIAEAAGIGAQVGTMVESSIASAAGLHFATALANVRTVEMGGPLMITDDIGDLRAAYDRDRITLPDAPGLGVTVDEAAIRSRAESWTVIE